jgi:glutathione S-transferase
VQLYTYFRSSAAYRVRIALNLKGLSAEMVPIHLQKEGGLNKKPEYRAVNPQMRVPALTAGFRRRAHAIACDHRISRRGAS